MSNVGAEVERAVLDAVRQLSGFERAHDVYYVGNANKDGFWDRYEDYYKRYLEEFANHVDVSIKSSLSRIFKDHLAMAHDLKKKFEVFKGLSTPPYQGLKEALDKLRAVLRRNLPILDLLSERERDDINNRGRSLYSKSFYSSSIDDAHVSLAQIAAMVREVERQFDVCHKAVRDVVETDVDARLFRTIEGNLQRDAIVGKRTGDILIETELTRVDAFVTSVASIAERLGDRSFGHFVKDFSADSPDKYRKLAKNHLLAYSAQDFDAAAGLDGLYTPEVVSGFRAFVDALFSAIHDKAKPLGARADTGKKVRADLVALEKALKQADPGNYKSPNHVSNRGPRFVWAEAKSALDAFLSSYGSAAVQADQDASLEAQGFLYRKPDLLRMQFYTAVVRKFRDDISKSDSSLEKSRDALVKQTNALIEDANGQIEALSKEADASYAHYTTQRLALKKYSIMRAYLREAKRLIGKYVQLHVDFALKQNRQGLRYMTYWRLADVNSKDAQDNLDTYFATLNSTKSDSVTTVAINAVEQMRNSFMGVYNDDQAAILRNMDVKEVESLALQFEAFERWCNEHAHRKVATVHLGPPGIFDVLSDSQVAIIYALKLLRFSLVFVALAIARRAFTSMYSERVYDRSGAPPHPAIMVGIFLGIDASFNAMTAIVLYLANAMLLGDSGFDSYLMSRWALDAVASTVVIALLALVMSHVVAKRRYFRYRFEGERGIRALESLVRNSAGVVLLLPFYRLAD